MIDELSHHKNKGLQKLKYYCQACRKQCKDVHGFKMHCSSEGHQRMMGLVIENPNRVIGEYSQMFEKSFMDLLHRKHSTSEVDANKVYCEYIGDKQHTHMNATRWTTLSQFIHHLERAGKVELSPREEGGWNILYLDKSPEALNRKLEIKKREKIAKKEKERQRIREMDISSRADRMRELAIDHKIISNIENIGTEPPEPPGPPGPSTEPISFSMDIKRPTPNTDVKPTQTIIQQPGIAENQANIMKINPKPSKTLPQFTFMDTINKSKQNEAKKKYKKIVNERSKLPRKRGEESKPLIDLCLEQDKRRKERKLEQKSRNIYIENKVSENIYTKDKPWIRRGIVVKIQDEEVGEGKYNGEKGVIRGINPQNKYLGEVKVIHGGDILLLDQELLETVVPQIGHSVRVLYGEYEGLDGVLQHIDITQGIGLIHGHNFVINLPFHAFSKIP